MLGRFFFFKQKTAYEMRISDWSSDVCSSDLYKPDDRNSISLRSIYTIFTDDEARDNYRFDLDHREADLSNSLAACTVTPNTAPPTSGYAHACIGNTPQNDTVHGIDIRNPHTLPALPQTVFTSPQAAYRASPPD